VLTFEGGSDHVPFLRADIPSVLFWHFTDQFYHTDNDRIDKVSKTTLKNVGKAALVSAYTLINANEDTAKSVIKSIEIAALARLNEELKQSKIAMNNGIIRAWEDWYIKAITTTNDMVTLPMKLDIETAQKIIRNQSQDIINTLKRH